MSQMKKIDEIIQMVREEMTVANAPGQSGGFGENSPKEGPTAGYSQLIKKYKMILQSLGLA